MLKTNSITIVIPCYNERKNLPKLFNKISNFQKKNKNFSFILVENGSTDNSYSLLKRLTKKSIKINILKIKRNKGYGHGIYRGLIEAKKNSDFIGWTHADLQTDINDLSKINKLTLKNKMFIKGFRNGRPLIDNFFSKGMSYVASKILGYEFTDINAQPSIFSTDLNLNKKKIPPNFMFDLYIYLQAQKQNFNIKRVKVFFHNRLYGKSKWNNGLYSLLKFIILNLYYIILFRNDNYRT